MTESLSVEYASRSDIGRVRTANEDCFGEAERSDHARLWIVADGMGGHRGGATASRTAVETIRSHFERSSPSRFFPRSFPPETDFATTLGLAIEAANQRVYAAAQRDPSLEGMGTTVVTLGLDRRGRGAIAHVGDSRGYRLRGRALEALTADHSVIGEMRRRGLLSEAEAAAHPRRNEILRSVGVAPYLQVEVSPIEIQPGDRVLLCSDGLTGLVIDLEIESILARHRPQQAAEEFIRLANERGGFDNITVQVLAF
jgi:protein phosphatase